MSYPLHDFRIENENLILLSFANGTTARVQPNDLAEYLSKPDLARVTKAMSARRKFIKRVLPPTAVVLLSASILALGAHDARQFMNHLQSPQPTAKEQPLSAQPEPAQATSTQQSARLPATQYRATSTKPNPVAPSVAAPSSSATAKPTLGMPGSNSKSSGIASGAQNTPSGSSRQLIQSIPHNLKSLLKPD
ncbi:MAG TPA: hypothetical protein VF272_02830 [Candidatus Saccharimonadia bacterium]